MWKKRVLVTQWAGQAWDELCHTFDFAAAARKIGMLMTIDGTNDDLIRIDGVEKYTFTDADAGDLPANEASDDDDEEEEEEDDVPPPNLPPPPHRPPLLKKRHTYVYVLRCMFSCT